MYKLLIQSTIYLSYLLINYLKCVITLSSKNILHKNYQIYFTKILTINNVKITTINLVLFTLIFNNFHFSTFPWTENT